GEGRYGGDWPCAHYHLRPSLEDWCHQRRDEGRAILVVCVSVDYDICSRAQSRLKAGHEGTGEPTIAGMSDDMINAMCASDFRSSICRSVVDDQPFHLIKARNPAWKVCQRYW